MTEVLQKGGEVEVLDVGFISFFFSFFFFFFFLHFSDFDLVECRAYMRIGFDFFWLIPRFPSPLPAAVLAHG